MTPTLTGRIQTRFFLLATVAVIWTGLLVPILPLQGMAGRGVVYRATFVALAVTAILGAVFWEPLYHLLQQWRWEKDWPILIGLLQGVPEGVAVYLVTTAIVGSIPAMLFVIHFASTWVVVWLFANGPMRVLFLRWRYRGGRVV